MAEHIRFYKSQPVHWNGEGYYLPGDNVYWEKVDSQLPGTVKLEAVDVFHWNVVIVNKKRGYFEHPCGAEGILELEGKLVLDFDGVYELPNEVVLQLRMNGFAFDKGVLPIEQENSHGIQASHQSC